MNDKNSETPSLDARSGHIGHQFAIRLKAFFSMSNTRLYKENRFRFLAVGFGALLIGAAILPQRGPTPTPEFTTAAIPKIDPIDISRHDLFLENELMPSITHKSVTLKPGDNLGPLLQRNGLTGQKSHRVTTAMANVYKPRNLRAGQVFNLYFEAGNLSHMIFKPSLDQTVFVASRGDSFTAEIVDAEFKMDRVTVRADIQNSLYLDASRLGAPDKVIQQFANIYEYSVDFQRDIQPGDNFEMFFEVARDHKGQIIKSGDLLYTSFSPRGKTMEYYLFTDNKARENFYDVKGKTAKRKLRATPINGARLSSSYGRRKHPILGYRKMHAGVDFAAPRGTPILAAGSGTVERANRYGGYGNYIRIRHTDGYKTAYAHLKSFARGVRAGKYVKQDQVIGYVGTTGRSTGPHLHYEVHLNGKKINPRRLSQLSGKPLAKTQMPAFKDRRIQIDNLRSKAEVIEFVPQPSAVMSAETTNP